MFARSLALFAIISISAAASDLPAANSITIYLKSGAADVSAVSYMKRELSGLMQTAGYRLEWVNASAAIPDVRNGQLVVLALTGDCTARRGSGESSEDLGIDSLASTPVSDGEILPFSTLHCDTLNRVIGGAITPASDQRRPWLYGRAMARLAAHELYHILTNTRVHSQEGVSKPCFSARDLLADHFEFETAALAKMRHGASAEISASPIPFERNPKRAAVTPNPRALSLNGPNHAATFCVCATEETCVESLHFRYWRYYLRFRSLPSNGAGGWSMPTARTETEDRTPATPGSIPLLSAC